MRNSLDLQRALHLALSTDPTLQAMALPIYDGPPVDARPPYLVIGNDTVVSRRWQGGDGEEHRFAVSLWDNREGVAAAKSALAEVERVVLGLATGTGGLRLVGIRTVRGSVRRTQKGWTLGQLEFRVMSVREN